MSFISSQVKINPRRAADGFPLQRLQLLCAVLEKRLKLSLWSRDVYLNVAGGLKISEPASDLAVAVTIVSSLVCMNIIPGIAFIGEIGLSGEIRCVKSIEIRVAEAMKMGFTTIIIPKIDKSKKSTKNKSSNYLEYMNKNMKTNENIKNENNGIVNNNDSGNNNENFDSVMKAKSQRDYDKNKSNDNNNNNNGNNKNYLKKGVIECSTLFEVLTIALNVDSFENILDRVKRSSKKKKTDSSLEKRNRNGNEYNEKNYDQSDDSNDNDNDDSDDNDNDVDDDDDDDDDDSDNRSMYDYKSNK